MRFSRTACSRTGSSTPTGSSVTTTCSKAPNMNEEGWPGHQPGQLHHRVRPLSDRDRARCRPDPADRDVGGEGRRLAGNAERRPVLAPAGQCAGSGPLRTSGRHGRILQALQARSREVWPAELIAKMPEIAGKHPLRGAYKNGNVDNTRSPRRRKGSRTRNPSTGFYLQKACSGRNTRRFGRGHATTWRRSSSITRRAA